MKNIYRALANFQQEVPTIHKGTAGYGYSYADLTAIYKIINPLMKKHGLGFTQPIVNNQMKTIVFHVDSGESIESVTDIPMNVQLKGQNDYQVMGSAFTYFRRYTLSSMLGLVTDKDIDASGEQTGKRKETITDERLHAALEKIKKGEYTMDKLKEKFELTTQQLELC